MKKKYLLFGTIFFVLISCKSHKIKLTVHPTEENLLSDGSDTHVIGRDSTSYSKTVLQPLAQKIKNAQLITEIGKTITDNSEIIGNIQYGSFHDNYIYLLDDQKMKVTIYDITGNYISSVGREGRGPGELINPESIIAYQDFLFILNNHFGVQVFKKSLTDNNNYKPYSLLNLKFRPDDICINNDKLIVNTLPVSSADSDLQNDNNISVFSVDDLDHELNSFGKMYVSDSWFAKMHMSMGGIECSPHSATIVQYFRNVGTLFAYNIKGKNLWKSKIADFNYLKLIEQAGTLGPDRNNPQDNFDTIENLIYINDKYFLIQVFNRRLLENRYEIMIKTYLADFESGDGVFVSNSLPKILCFNFEKRLYATFDNNDKPKVSIFKF